MDHRAVVAFATCIVLSGPSPAETALPPQYPQLRIPADFSVSGPSTGNWGSSVAGSGDFVIVGASTSKIAEVYRRTVAGWTFSQSLSPPGLSNAASSLMFDDDRLLCLASTSSSSRLLEYTLAGDLFAMSQSLSGPSGELWGPIAADGERIAIAVSGSGVKVRTLLRDSEGRWINEGMSTLTTEGSWLSRAVAIRGDRMVATRATQAYGSMTDVGAVYIARLEPEQGTWGMEQLLKPPIERLGMKFGQSVVLLDQELFIGATGWSDGMGVARGLVFHYRLGDDGIWTLDGVIESPEPQPFEGFGHALWSDGMRLLVATNPIAVSKTAPRVWSFIRTGDDSWSQGAALAPPSPIPSSMVFRAIASDGTLLVVGDRAKEGFQAPTKASLTIVDRVFDCDSNGIDDAVEIDGGQIDCDGDRRVDGCQSDSGLPLPACIADCDGDGIPDLLEIAEGIATDCNLDRIPDDCRLAAALSPDANDDGLPDACQGDCDGDGVLDVVEISLGTALDHNHDGFPDACPAYASGPSISSSFSVSVQVPGSQSYYFAHRFTIEPGRERIAKVGFVTKSWSQCSASDKLVRVSLHRDIGGGAVPFQALPLWSIETHTAKAGTWTTIDTPDILAGEAGEGVFLVVQHRDIDGCFSLAGSDNCSMTANSTCGNSWAYWVEGDDWIPLEDLLAPAFGADYAWVMRLWTTASLSADLNQDGVVNGDDLGSLLAEWGANPGSVADLNGDQFVNGDDLGMLLGSWS